MKEPDKKYLLSIVGELLASMPANEVVFMPNKIYFDGVDTSTTPRLAINEEYVRKDALISFLEKEKDDLFNWHFQDEDRKFKVYEEVIDKIKEL